MRHSSKHFMDSLWTANIARDAVWDPDHKITLSFRGNEIAGEVGELCNQLKKIERVRLGLRGSLPSPEILREEIADVMICLSLICMHLNISPLEFLSSVANKFNKTSKERGLEVYLALSDSVE